MNRALLQLFLLAGAFCGADAQQTNVVSRKALPPLPPSPVSVFRMLLTTNGAGREQWLALRTPEQQKILRQRIAEYSALPGEDLEARLQSLRLQSYLRLLMKQPFAQRTNLLGRIPQPERGVLEAKLKTWDILPPPLRQDLLSNALAISVLLPGKAPGHGDAVLRSLSPEKRQELEAQFAQLNALPAERREQIFGNFKRYFELPAVEQASALQKLSAAERAQMERTLTSFDKLAPSERVEAAAGLRKFSQLSAAERAAFLQQAERWKAMTEAERDGWRQRLARLRAQKILPPLPMPPRKSDPTLAGKVSP